MVLAVVNGLIRKLAASRRISPNALSRRQGLIAVSQRPLLHPPDGNEVVQAYEEAIPDSVLGHPMRTGEVTDRNFRHAEPLHLGQGREKAVHPLEQLELLHDHSTEHFQGATGVSNAVAGDHVPHKIGNAGGESS